MGEAHTGAANEPRGAPGEGSSLSLISTQLSWMRSDLSNLRTLLSWARTSVSMIGFGFTIYNFYRGFLEDLAEGGRADAARNLGLVLVAAGTLGMVIAVFNYWAINRSLVAMGTTFPLPSGLQKRWIYAYTLAAVLILIGFVTLLFMLRVI
jgi:putative membrane protein